MQPLIQLFQISFFSTTLSAKEYITGSRFVEQFFGLYKFKFNDSISKISEKFLSSVDRHNVYK